MAKHLILCDCLKSQTIDAAALSKATGLTCSRVHTALCTRESEAAAKAIAGGDVIIACGQEIARFSELAAELDAAVPDFVDIRDRAGWTDDADATAKMAALVAEATLAAPPFKTRDVTSQGMCLIIGASKAAIPAAESLADALAVTVLLTDGDDDLPLRRDYEVVTGQLRQATGSFGHFEITLDALQTVEPGGRGGLTLTAPRDGAVTQCDVILDLTGGTPLFPAPHKRDGYLRADPGSIPAVAKAVAQAREMIGTFEKTIFLRIEEHLCAHSRAGQIGCSRCLDACPTGAITPNGEHVEVDPMICAGCGACAALCPSGAISYDAPAVADTLRRVSVLADTYRKAGGVAPRLLVHDNFGAEMIGLAARFGRGLPADVIPFHATALLNMGHAEMLAALAAGFAGVDIVLAPTSERAPLEFEVALAEAMGGQGRLRLLDLNDPDALCDALYGTAPKVSAVQPVLTMGNRRQITRLAAQSLNPNIADPLPLPEGAPYGAVNVDTDACTLCLSCVSLCPSGALLDNPDMPQLRFQEDACLQCGVCAKACPEDAITLAPRLDLTDAAIGQRILNKEEPFCCVECGKPFGVKSTVEKIIAKLEGKHAMFAEGGAARLIQMCDDCRINAQYHSQNNPLGGGERPRVRTTDDYFSKRRDH